MPEPVNTSAAQAKEAELIGRLLGKYRVIRKLGRGGMGVVFEAEDTVLKRRVAIKLLPQDIRSNATAVERFFMEAQAAARLNHPNVIAIHDIGYADESFFMVIELLKPESAAGYLRTRGPMHWEEATRVLADCCAGVYAAHQAGLIHRDIKPDNIMCSFQGKAKVADFGLVKELGPDSVALSHSGLVAGTPIYMSPEQCSNLKLDPRSDIYSLGATYYALLTGQPPHLGPNVMEILVKHVSEPTPDPRRLVPGIPEACVQIINRATAKEPDERYQSAEEMRIDLEAALTSAGYVPWRFLTAAEDRSLSGGQRLGMAPPPVQTPKPLEETRQSPPAEPVKVEPPVPDPPPRPVRKKHIGMIGAGLALVCLCVVLALFFRQRSRASTADLANSGLIKVGVIYALSGSTATVERAAGEATLQAIAEINQQGGLNGRRIEAFSIDGAQDADRLSASTERLITDENVAVLFSSSTPQARKVLKDIVERHDHLLVHFARHEGLEDSSQIVYLGAAPSQYAVPAIKYSIEQLGIRRFFLIGSDALFSHSVNAVLSDEIHAQKALITGERYLLWGDVYFASTLKKIRAARPGMIVSSLQGDASIAFFRALSVAGLGADQIPILSLALDESSLVNLTDIDMKGHYLAGSEQLRTPALSGRSAVQLWTQAVRAAESTEPRRVRLALRGLSASSLQDVVRLTSGGRQAFHTFRLARIEAGNKVKIVANTSQALEPIAFPVSRTQTQWDHLLSSLFMQWGNHWANPERPRIPK